MKRTHALKTVGAVILLCAVAALCTVGCGDASGEGGEPAAEASPTELHLYTWAEAFPAEVLDGFEEETGIEVTVDAYESNEAMVSKLQAGASGYDLVSPSQYAVQQLSGLGLIEELDHSRIPNIGNLSEEFTQLVYDPGNKWAIPMFWGTTGIAWNSKYITTEIDSFEALWDEAYKGKIMMLDNMLACYIPALQINGYSANSKDPEEIEVATQSLLEQEPLLQGYNSTNYAEQLARGNVWVSLAWSSDVARAMQDSPELRYALPTEGGTYWTDSLSLVKDAPDVEAAYMFLEYVLRPDIGAKLCELTGMAVANAAAAELLPAETRDNPAIYPRPEQVANADTILDPEAAATYFQTGWTEVRAQ